MHLVSLGEAVNLEKKKAFFVVFIAAVLLVSAFGIRELLSLEQPTGEEYRRRAEELLTQGREEFENIRGISVREVALEVVNQSWVEENWGEVSGSEREELLRGDNIYKALFLISQDYSLLDARLEWTISFRAAKWQGKLYVVEENFDVTEESRATGTFVHELTHIMQETYSLPDRTKFDGSKALSALKEGDATLMADTSKNGGVVPSPAEVIKSSSATIPESVDKLNRFVYRYGLEFVKTLYDYNSGSWVSIDEAYLNPPTTTEQIIHPEKYIEQEQAKSVGAISVDDDWNLIETDSFGEYFVYVMLDNWISDDDATEAASGWGGDAFCYYEKDGEFCFTWNITWDTEYDAHEFDLAFQDMMYQISAEKHNCSYWSANGRYIYFEVNGSSTLIVSSPDEEMIQQSFLD
ncbi:MAG: hypothetical protein P8X84_01205 [Candidatus Bathyarchaeota archaeon]